MLGQGFPFSQVECCVGLCKLYLIRSGLCSGRSTACPSVLEDLYEGRISEQGVSWHFRRLLDVVLGSSGQSFGVCTRMDRVFPCASAGGALGASMGWRWRDFETQLCSR